MDEPDFVLDCSPEACGALFDERVLVERGDLVFLEEPIES